MSTYEGTAILFRASGLSPADRSDAATRARWALPKGARVRVTAAGAQALLILTVPAASEAEADQHLRDVVRSTGLAADSYAVRKADR